MYSNLAGQGPDYQLSDGSIIEPEIRYANVGKVFSAALGRELHIDFVVTALDAYTPANATLNGLQGQFARISIATGTSTDLRLSIFESCAQSDSCQACENLPTQTEVDACYSTGCSCFADHVTSRLDCTGGNYTSKKEAYGCSWMDKNFTLTASGLLSISVFDFDGGPSGGCREQVEWLTPYVYPQTPLRPSSGNSISTKVQGSGPIFTSPDDGLPATDPSDPTLLTDDQASRGVQIFVRPALGYVEARLNAAALGVGGSCATGGEFLFEN